jgi:hypothetical protein
MAVDHNRLRQLATKAATLNPRGWWLLLEAQVAVFQAQARVRRRPRGELVRELASDASPGTPAPTDPARAEEIALALERVSRLGVGRPLCLARSIALHDLLERKGIGGSNIRVGVRLRDGHFEAHAWVELGGRLLGDDPSFVKSFTPLADLADWPVPGAAPGFARAS